MRGHRIDIFRNRLKGGILPHLTDSWDKPPFPTPSFSALTHLHFPKGRKRKAYAHTSAPSIHPLGFHGFECSERINSFWSSWDYFLNASQEHNRSNSLTSHYYKDHGLPVLPILPSFIHNHTKGAGREIRFPEPLHCLVNPHRRMMISLSRPCR